VNKKYVGNSILVLWFVFSLWAGVEILIEHGEKMHEVNFPFVAFLLVWVLAMFIGRFFIEWGINKLWR
jgi:hypothetical protein